MPGARPIVDPPEFTPLPYGLWDSIQHPTAPSHWQNGVTWVDRCPQGSTTWDECIAVTGTGEIPEPPSKTPNVDQTFRGATPITIYAEFECSPVGIGNASTAATEALAQVESTRLEESFWTGMGSGGTEVFFPHLAADAEVSDPQGILLQSPATVCATGVDVVRGLGELERCLAECHAGQGVIHIPPEALPSFVAYNLAISENGTFLTPAGHILVVGSGYPGTSPTGAEPAAGTTWIYGTGSMFGYRGEVSFTTPPQSFDRAENTMQMIAERTYVLGWRCCHFAVQINLGVDGA